MASTMLTGVFREMDDREMFDQTEGRIPFVLLDDHGSRAKLELAQRASDPHNLLTVRAYMPRGANLW